MARSILFYIIVLLADVFSATTGRYAYDNQSFTFLILCMLGLVVIGYFFIRLLEDSVGIILNVIFLALGAINVTVFSYFIFGEKINYFQGLAMLVILFGLFLIQFYDPSEKI